MAACVCPGKGFGGGPCGNKIEIADGLCGACRRNGCQPAGWTTPVPASPPVLEVPLSEDFKQILRREYLNLATQKGGA